MMPTEIRTARLHLHPHRPDEAEAQFAVVDAERARIGAWVPWVERTHTALDMRQNMESWLKDWELGTMFNYTMKDEHGALIGAVALLRIEKSIPRGEIGYWVRASAEGKGYVTEAATAIEAAAWQAGFQRLEICCEPRNLRSHAVPARLGFQLEGILRQNFRLGGRLQDTMVWSKLRHEARHEPKAPRPSCIGHWSAFLGEDDARYPGSKELIFHGASIGAKLGLKAIGVHVGLLPPGRRTSWPHAESLEEEFVFVLEGTPDVWMDGHLHRLGPGDFVAFPAGTGIAHTFLNNTQHLCKLLVGGEASKDANRIHYPLHPARNEQVREKGCWWSDAPCAELGGHDGFPDALRTKPVDV